MTVPSIGRPTVVVIGGGYGGVNVAKGLDDVADVVLVEPKDAFQHNVAALGRWPTPRGCRRSGAVGIELAGEIKAAWPGKQVRLLDAAAGRRGRAGRVHRGHRRGPRDYR